MALLSHFFTSHTICFATRWEFETEQPEDKNTVNRVIRQPAPLQRELS